MPAYKAPLNDMKYVLYDVFKAHQQWQASDIYSHCTPDIADAILAEAVRINEDLIAPLNRQGDEQGVRLKDGQVITADGFKEAFRVFADNGWVGLGGNPEYGGQGMPKSLMTLTEEMCHAACSSFCMYSILTSGAAFAIDSHATDDIRQRFLPNMHSGKWSGAMAMTEAHAGSDLGLIKAKAEPNDDGTYSITGTKIFITGGDQDMTENVIHLVLAKIPGSPEGTRGISMFLIPKIWVNDDGSTGDPNHVTVGSLEEKMGIHASSTCVMNYDGARGYMIGEVNRGLACMFTMMNYERLTVGVQGLGLAQLSYQLSVEYARERLQGRAPGSISRETADPIIQHGDVRRMLMTQKAMVEAGRAFSVYAGLLLDMAKIGEGAESERAEKMVALLTPVAKAFLTDMGFDMCVIGQQVFGGHGYIREWGVEQLVRDARIGQIYEGTNGIQAMDLLDRKVIGSRGEYLGLFLEEVNDYMAGLNNTSMLPFIEALKYATNTVEQLSKTIVNNLQNDKHLPGTAAVDYLKIMGHLVFAYMWTRMAEASMDKRDDAFHDAKVKTGLFYIQRLLPCISSLAMGIVQGADSTMSLDPEQF